MENTNGQTQLLATVEHKNPKKRFAIYEDRIVFNGNTVLYDDIQEINVMMNSVMHGLAVTQFVAQITFKLKNGKKKPYSINGIKFFGLGNEKAQKERAVAVINKIYHLTAAEIAKRFVNEVRQGKSLEFGKLTIDEHRAVFPKAFKKELVIDKTNFNNYVLTENEWSVFPVYKDEKDKEIAPWTSNNMILMPYILEELYS